LIIALVANVSVVAAESMPSTDPYKMCVEGNAESRKAFAEGLAAAPVMPEFIGMLLRFMLDDQVCDCIKVQDANAAATVSPDPCCVILLRILYAW